VPKRGINDDMRTRRAAVGLGVRDANNPEGQADAISERASGDILIKQIVASLAVGIKPLPP
jgi:hypothetical protein